MFSVYKNSYLQTTYKEINPRLLNRCVQKARDLSWIDAYDVEPPFQRLTSEQPNLPVQNVDLTRRPIAFGRRAMPKLRRELHDKDENVVIAALESIADLCHDPERACEAIHLKIVDRMVDILMADAPEIRERTAYALQIIARHAIGREAIVANPSLLDNLQISVEDLAAEVREQVAALLEMVARSWISADVLVDYNFIQILLSVLSDEHPNIIALHLETLKSLMHGMGKCVALESDAFHIFLKLLESKDSKVISSACDCLTLLTTSQIGENLAQEVKLLETLNQLLHDERPEVYTSAASTIMFCTIKTKSKLAAGKIKDMAPRLIKIAKNKANSSTQIFALKALTNICEHPEVRKEVKNNYFQDLLDIQLGGEPRLKEYKKNLLTIVNWTPICV